MHKDQSEPEPDTKFRRFTWGVLFFMLALVVFCWWLRNLGAFSGVPVNEIEVLGVGVHSAATWIHLKGAKDGELTPREQGALVTLHLLGIVHNEMLGNRTDSLTHIVGLFATFSRSRLAHLAIGAYDGAAAIGHVRRI